MAWEPHHDIIDDPADVLIYELVLGDVNGDPTTLLERAHAHLKDNRMTPRGFSTAHAVYDTTAIIGGALEDPNFNIDPESGEGSGADRIQYLLPEGWNQHSVLTVECTVWYQAIPPKWVAPMLELQGDSLIDGFRQLYAEFAPLPERIADITLEAILDGVKEQEPSELTAWPNPTEHGRIQVDSPQALGNYILFDATGRQVESGQCPQGRLALHLPSAGRYVLRTEAGSITLLRN